MKIRTLQQSDQKQDNVTVQSTVLPEWFSVNRGIWKIHQQPNGLWYGHNGMGVLHIAATRADIVKANGIDEGKIDLS